MVVLAIMAGLATTKFILARSCYFTTLDTTLDRSLYAPIIAIELRSKPPPTLNSRASGCSEAADTAIESSQWFMLRELKIFRRS